MRIVLPLFLFLAACHDGALGFDGKGIPDGGSGAAALDAPCMNSPYDGRQLLGLLASTYAAEYVPTDPDSDIDTEAWAAAHRTALTITVGWAGGAIGCAAPKTLCPPGPGCFTTAPTLSADLDIGFQTADGIFDEQLKGTASWLPEPPITTGQTVTWQAQIPSTSVHGSYQVWSGTGALGTPEQVDLLFRGSFNGASYVDGEVDETAVSGPNVGTLGDDGGGMFGDAL